MVFDKISDFYESVHGQPLKEPTSEQDVKNILSCIRAMHGYLDSDDEAQLQKTTSTFQKKLSLMTSNSREVLARFTKVVSSQLYDDPFRFFFELIQNADDANYSGTVEAPTINFAVTSTELLVDLNEDGFTLADVLSICDTAQSSKLLNHETTGEKGFGFKAVFGVADRVHIISGLWSFRFEHQRHEDGLGMISPIWEPPGILPDGVRTRFRLRYAAPEQTSLEDICARLEAQHASVLFALRKLRKLTISFLNVMGRNHTIRFEKQKDATGDIMKITSDVSGTLTEHDYLTCSRTIIDMPAYDGRLRPNSVVTIGLPLTTGIEGVPRIASDGQYVFAYLPVMQMPQLPFVIQADFILPGSRQSIVDNAWNRRLRDEIAQLFATTVEKIVLSKGRLSYEWLDYVPNQQFIGFWQPFPDIIKRCLSGRKIYYSNCGTLLSADVLRELTPILRHGNEPILSETWRQWRFLSTTYHDSHFPLLRCLGIAPLTYPDILQLIDDDLWSYRKIHSCPLEDQWHDAFAELLQESLKNSKDFRKQIIRRPIVPVRTTRFTSWNPPGPTIYFPNLVDDGSGVERIVINIPAMLDLTVVQPLAANKPWRRKLYEQLGVRHCPPRIVCTAIEAAQENFNAKPDRGLVSCMEILFWFSHTFSDGARDKVVAMTAHRGWDRTKNLYMRSDQPYHAEKLLLHVNPKYNDRFLSRLYQDSQVSTRSRGGWTWEQWLHHIAGIRWFPPLVDISNHSKLHWMISAIRDENPAMFVPTIQNHWSESYGPSCNSNSSIKQALMTCKVLCENGKTEELQKTWFPTSRIKEVAQYLALDRELSILSLPGSTENHLVSQWPCLRELGVGFADDLSFYREALNTLVAVGTPSSINVQVLGWLYARIGNLAKLEDREKLRDDFLKAARIWNPVSNTWHPLDQCVWSCPISLTRKFVLTPTYKEDDVSGLFRTMLNAGDVTIAHLVDELQHLRDSSKIDKSTRSDPHPSPIYALIDSMVKVAENRKWLRSVFKENALIYSDNTNQWLKSDSCVWHSTIEVGDTVPIANNYPELRGFFVETLGVSTVTDVFMMKELASAATKQRKLTDVIKNLMLSTSVLLNNNTDCSKFDGSLKVLRQIDFLPCRSLSGEIKFCSVKNTFFIVDNQYFGEAFSGKLAMLDFTYEELNSLYRLLDILGLSGHYLTKHLRTETSAESSLLDTTLTGQFQQCAYAISCCAIAHRSPEYSNHDSRMHNLLLNAEVRLSSNMATKLVVTQDNIPVKISTSKVSLIVARQEDKLVITLPSTETDRRKCMRGALCQHLAKLLQIDDCGGERQIYRIINESNTSTNDILSDEQISQVSWLSENHRPCTTAERPSASITPAPPSSQTYHSDDDLELSEEFELNSKFEEHRQVNFTSRLASSIPINNAGRPPIRFRSLPAFIDHQSEAPQYRTVLEHVRKQANLLGNSLGDSSTLTADNLMSSLAALTLESTSLDPAHYPSLFGSDIWLSKFRVGAAGELFIYSVLQRLSRNTLGLDNWQSKIRHLVQVHEEYRHITQWSLPETADITFKDQNNVLRNFFLSKPIGDNFSNWHPDRLENLNDVEWLFEVKTTIGPCETDFFMSQSQYKLMRGLSGKDDTGRRRVYCIVRIYNLLSDRIGVRIFIDPWRFRESLLEFGTTDKWKVTAV